LSKKKYEFRPFVKYTAKVSDQVTIDQNFAAGDSGIVGTLKTTCAHGDKVSTRLGGETEVNVVTDGSLVEAKVKLNKLHPNLTSTCTLNVRPSFGLLFEHALPSAATSLSVDVADDTVVSPAFVFRHQGVSLGGGLSYSLKNGGISDKNIGVEFANDKVTATFVTKRSFQQVMATFVHTKDKTQLGFAFQTEVEEPKRYQASFAAEHQVSPSTCVKGCVNSDMQVAVHFEQRTPNPNVKYTFSSLWNMSRPSSAPERYGFGFTFGDI